MSRVIFIALCCILVAAGAFWFVSRMGQKAERDRIAESPALRDQRTPPSERVIDYGKLKDGSDESLSSLMKERKEPYGIEEGLDMVVKEDESIKVGEETVAMQDVVDEVRLKRGEVLEVDLKTGTGEVGSDDYGIHVVQPGENIWDIHFTLLKDYFDHKGVELSPLSDEPDRFGYSSGVGKILKFSEKMVYIYNVRDRRIETNLDMIYPLTKIVVYEMGPVFALLDRINYQDVERIAFDGETLWLPAEE